jgi:predicted phosphodiesterase
MRFGIISDIHGNWPALLCVLRALRQAQVDRIFSLGDLVGYNAHPDRCARLIRDLGIEGIAGNHDLIAIGRLSPASCAFRPAFALRRTRAVIAEDVRHYLQGLPSHLFVPDQVALVHGSPGNVQEYLRTPEALLRAAQSLAVLEPRARVCFFGHTHERAVVHVAGEKVDSAAATGRQILGRDAGVFFVNPGSVDAARRRKKQAEFVIFEPETRTLEFHAVAYKHEIAESMARSRGYRMPPWREAAHSAWHWGWRAVVRRLWSVVKYATGG